MFEMKKIENEKISLDEVLDKFSMFGRYHLKFMFCTVLGFLYTSSFGHNFIFAVEEIKYRCSDEAFINDTCGVVNGGRCTEWVYDNPHSFVAEFQLACQDWKRALVGTSHIFGYMMGLFVVGPSSDRIGRKKTLIWTAMSGAVIGVAKSFSRSYWLYVSLEFLCGMFGDNYSPLYVLNLEIVSAKKRVIYHFLCHVGTYIGGILLALSAWGIPYWRTFVQVTHLPGFLFITYFLLIDESPRWLLSNGKKAEAIAIIEKMSRNSKMQINKENLEKLTVEDEENSIKFSKLLRITFQSRILLQRWSVCIVWWITSTFVYHGMMINTVTLQGNRFINYGLASLIQLVGNFILMYILHKLKRKNPLRTTFLAAALLCLVQPFLPTGVPWLSVAVFVVGSLMSSLFFGITYIYTLELFPTYTRNSMHAMCSAIGRVGAIMAPQTPLLLVYWSGLPMVVFGAASLAAGLVTFLVPDTANDALPDTVREAENIGKKKRVRIGIVNEGMSLE